MALVYMMPELSSGHSHPLSPNKQKECHWLAIILQVLGMFSGIFIMLTIESTIMDMAMGTEETEVWNSSVLFDCVLVVFRRIGMI